MWSQVYDPFGSMILSTAVAALPVIVLLGGIGILELRAHVAALLGLAAALAVAILAYGMPVKMAGLAAAYGAAFGLLPIGWIILNVIFLYQLTSEKGDFEILRRSISAISDDRRLQLLFIAFCLGAFFEGAAGFGTPVAVTAAMLIGLGFSPLAASGLSLIANTAPVAFGALGTPIIALAAVTGLDLHELSAMVGRQLPFFSVIVPFWLDRGVRRLSQDDGDLAADPRRGRCRSPYPSISFRIFTGPGSSTSSPPSCRWQPLALFLRVWRPANPMTAHAELATAASRRARSPRSAADPMPSPRSAGPGCPGSSSACSSSCGARRRSAPRLDGMWAAKVPVAGLHELVQKMPPVVAAPHIESAVFNLNILSATGTGILLAAHRLRALSRLQRSRPRAHVRPHALPRPLLAAHDRLHAGDRLRHALLGHRRDARPRIGRAPAGFIRFSAR